MGPVYWVGPVCFHVKVWPVGNVRGRESSDRPIWRDSHADDGDDDEDVGLRCLLVLMDLMMDLVRRTVDRGVDGVRGGDTGSLCLFMSVKKFV